MDKNTKDIFRKTYGSEAPLVGVDGTNEDDNFRNPQKGSHVDKIMNLEKELKMLNDDNMNPHDIYLQHCRQFARSNFDLQSLNIETYKIKPKDVNDNIFFRENNDHHEMGNED